MTSPFLPQSLNLRLYPISIKSHLVTVASCTSDMFAGLIYDQRSTSVHHLPAGLCGYLIMPTSSDGTFITVEIIILFSVSMAITQE